jgi:glutamate dehydrogenase (NAD(P)+)
MRAFGRAIRPFLEGGRLSIGLDIGTCAEDLGHMYQGAELASPATGLGATEIDGERLENLATGYGTVVAAKAACDAAGFAIEGCSAAVEGFGKAGSGAARYLAAHKAKVVAISTIEGALYHRDGLDVETLLALRRTYGDRLVEHYRSAERLPRQALYTLPVDILIPGARPNVIDASNVGQVRAKVISSVANNPIAREAEPELFRKGVRVVPDFISNAGGAVAVMVDWIGGTPADVFRVLDQRLSAASRAILSAAGEQNMPPTFVAVAQAERTIADWKRAPQRLSFEEIKRQVAARFRQQS